MENYWIFEALYCDLWIMHLYKYFTYLLIMLGHVAIHMMYLC